MHYQRGYHGARGAAGRARERSGISQLRAHGCDDKPIKGATKSTCRLTKADIGKTIRVKVTGTKAGYSSFEIKSTATKKVRR